MGNILVVAEHRNAILKKVSFPVVTCARQIAQITGGEVIGVVLGSNARGVADEYANYGLDRVIYMDGASFENYLAESYAECLAELTAELNVSHVVGPASIQGKDFLPRLAAQLDAGMVADVIEVWDDGGVHYRRPMWAGNVLAEVVVDSPIAVLSVRTTAFEKAAAGDAAPVEERSASHTFDKTECVGFDEVKSERPDLTDANVVVSGGRGMKTKENFKLLEDLADILGGAVGASRAAIDANMAPYDWQVGQTGKIVAPDLYFAVAISGAIQHVAGMKASKTIVAINKDPEAPIFQVADYGLVADAFKVLPELNEKMAEVKKGG